MEQAIQIINLDIQGMTCAGCVNSVEKALGNVDGVDLAEVNFAMNRAAVHYNPEIANPSVLESAVEEAGFEAQRLKDTADAPEPSEQSEKEYLKFRSKMWVALGFSVLDAVLDNVMIFNKSRTLIPVYMLILIWPRP